MEVTIHRRLCRFLKGLSLVQGGLVLLQRLFEERALNLYRQGRIAGSFYDGRGQESVAAAAGGAA